MSLVSLFADFRRIYGFCPCCGELFRMSELTLFTKTAPAKTPFDRLEDAQQLLQRSVERFDAQEDRLRAKARERGQKAAKQRLRAISPFFTQLRIDPNDVKVIFDPVDYVVFRGLTSGVCRALTLIDSPKTVPRDRQIQKSIRAAVRAGNLEWLTLNIADDGAVTSS